MTSNVILPENLRAFASYCKQRGWIVVPLIGKYEVLRMQPATKSGNSGLLIVYKNSHSEFLTTFDKSDELAKDFLREHKGIQPAIQQELF